MSGFSKLYEKTVLGHPVAVLVALTLVFSFFAYHARNFKLDASADSLMLEDDKDLQTYREVSRRYAIQEFLIVAMTPFQELFSRESLGRVQALKDALRKLDRVESVETILDVPLLKTSGLKLTEITAEGIKTLSDEGVDLQKAKEEILQSPIYRKYAISEDGKTTALKINLQRDTRFEELIRERNRLLAADRAGSLGAEESKQLERVLADYETMYAAFHARRHADIETVREIIKPYKQYGVVHLGGVPMIADDMITFIKSDLVVFGFGVFIFIVVTLTLIFREFRWVFVPLLNCFFSVVLMIGFLGYLNWKVTVISSNFISLMLILTMETNIHLAVRYRQLCRDMAQDDQRAVVATTVKKMVMPCLYTALTTILAFSSLVFSGIRPVIDFGWMMTIGLTITFLASFILFPAVLMLLKKSGPAVADRGQTSATAGLAWIAKQKGGMVIVTACALAAVSMLGITRLKVENSFVNYFSKKTEIYQGLKLIDDKLGGTMPLDVILSFGEQEAVDESAAANEGDDGELNDDDDFGWINDYDPRDYWFTPYKIEKIKQAHDFLESLPEIGKVMSLASVIRMVEGLNEGKTFDGLELGVIYKKIPDDIKTAVVSPYVSFDNNEARFSMRILDSRDDIRRNELLEKIGTGLQATLGLPADRITVTGLLVLYNNMLQSLFRSQILTLGIVMLGIALMLFFLFRSVSLAVIGIIPNILAVSIVLGIMGLLDIPLDMMTITIAAITMGIAIDNSIHYIYRFREEFAACGDYGKTLELCHANVGKAILNTSTTIIFGFSILVLSNFFPTIYFGLFTGLAMFIAMLAILTLMPRVILAWRPFTSR